MYHWGGWHEPLSAGGLFQPAEWSAPVPLNPAPAPPESPSTVEDIPPGPSSQDEYSDCPAGP